MHMWEDVMMMMIRDTSWYIDYKLALVMEPMMGRYSNLEFGITVPLCWCRLVKMGILYRTSTRMGIARKIRLQCLGMTCWATRWRVSTGTKRFCLEAWGQATFE